MMAPMKLEPYTVPEQDADLWECGVVLTALPAEGRVASHRASSSEASALVLGALAKCESATLLQIAATTRQSRYVTGGAIMKLAAVGAIRAVGGVILRSNNGVDARSRWTAVAREDSSAASAEWSAWLKKARAKLRAEAAADAKASEEAAEERRRQDEFEASRRARINGWTT